MSDMIITYYEGMGYSGGSLQIPQEPNLDVEVVDFLASVQSAEFPDKTKFISVQLLVDGYIDISLNPTAVATSGTQTSRLHEANAVAFYGVAEGFKIAAIAA